MFIPHPTTNLPPDKLELTMSRIKDELAAHEGKTLKITMSTEQVIVGQVEELEEDHAVLRDITGGHARRLLVYYTIFLSLFISHNKDVSRDIA